MTTTNSISSKAIEIQKLCTQFDYTTFGNLEALISDISNIAFSIDEESFELGKVIWDMEDKINDLQPKN